MDSVRQNLPFEAMYDSAMAYSVDELGNCIDEGWLKIVSPEGEIISLEIKHFRFESKLRFSMSARSADDGSSLYLSVVDGRYNGGVQLPEGNFDIHFVKKGLVVLTRLYRELGSVPFQDRIDKDIPIFKPSVLSEPDNDLPQNHSNTSILFLYGFELESKKSKSEIKAKSMQIIDYLRMARDLSGISVNSIDYTMAGTAYLPYKTLGVLLCPDYGPSDLSYLEENDEVGRLKDQYKADLLVFLSPNYGTEFPFFRGVASYESGIAIVSWDYATSTGIFTGIHEIGHLFGGKHEHCIDSGSEDCIYEEGLGRGYGFESRNKQWYSVMATNNKERQLEYSNPRKTHRSFGKAQGRFGLEDMTLQLTENAVSVAHRYETTSKRVQVSRSIELTLPRIFVKPTLNDNIVNYQISPNYMSHHRIDRVEWTFSNNGQDFQLYANDVGNLIIDSHHMPPWFLLRVQVWDNLGNTVSNTIIVSNNHCNNLSSTTRNYMSKNGAAAYVQSIDVNKLLILANDTIEYVGITNAKGQIIYEKNEASDQVIYEMNEDFPPMYFIYLYTHGEWLTLRVQI
ncbi:hypothetical protein GCM10025777_03870 [Membranihabitans marinus]